MTTNGSAPRPKNLGARGDRTKQGRHRRSASILARTTDNPLRPRLAPGGRDPAQHREALLARYRQELARRALVIGSIRAHLEEQPSDRSVRAAGRRWCRDITNLVDTVVTARRNQENDR